MWKTSSFYAIFLSCGIVWGQNDPETQFWALVTAGGCLGIYFFDAWHRKSTKRSFFLHFCAFSAFFGLGLANSTSQNRFYEENPVFSHLSSLNNPQSIEFTGYIYREPVKKGSKTDYFIKLSRFSDETGFICTNNCGKMRLSVSKTGENAPKYGDIIHAQATYIPLNIPRNPNAFDMRNYLRENRLIGLFECNSSQVTVLDSHGFFLLHWALAAKEKLTTTYASALSPFAHGLACGAVLGDKSVLSSMRSGGLSITDLFQRCGVSHVMAVSGLHVGVIALFFGFVLQKLRVPRVATCVIISLSLIFFLLITGIKPPTIRAVIMTITGLVLFLFVSRDKIQRTAAFTLSVSAIFILLYNPQLLFSPSFQLSFAAVISLLTLTPYFTLLFNKLRGALLPAAIIALALSLGAFVCRPSILLTPQGLAAFLLLQIIFFSAAVCINGRFPRLQSISCDRLPRSIIALLAAQGAIQVGMLLPLSAWYFGRFSVAGLVTNIAAIPLIGIFIQSALAGGIVSTIPLIGPLLAIPCFGITNATGFLFLQLCKLGKSLPYPSLPKPSLQVIMVYYAALAVLLLLLQLPQIRERIKYLFAVTNKSKYFRWGMGITVCLCIALIASSHAAISHPVSINSITILHSQPLSSGHNIPICLLNHDNAQASIINTVSSYNAERLLFRALNAKGILKINQLILATPHKSQQSGFRKLSELISVYNTVFYHEEHEGHEEKVNENRIRTSCSLSPSWFKNAEPRLHVLRALRGERKNKGYPIITQFAETKVLISSSVDILPDEKTDCDLLIASSMRVNSPRRAKTYMKYITELIAKTSPEFIIISGGNQPGFPQFLEALSKSFPHINFMTTSEHGAITISHTNNKLNLTGYNTGRIKI